MRTKKREQIEINIIQFWRQHLQEMDQYLEKMQATEEERLLVYQWVDDMNDFRQNPYHRYDENGNLLDYLSAYREELKHESSP